VRARAQTPSQVINSPRQIGCVLAHDHVLLRQGLRRLLEDEPDIEVLGEAGNAAECLRKVYELQPDVLVTDTAAFGLSTRETGLLVMRESPATKIVFLSMQEQSDAAFGDVPDGTGGSFVGCSVRQTSAQELGEMIRSFRLEPVANHPDNVPQAAPQDSALSHFPQPRSLTAREREVLKLLAEGKTVRAAASVLGLSSKTVDAHKFNLMRKLGTHNRAELVMWAIQKKVVKLPANF